MKKFKVYTDCKARYLQPTRICQIRKKRKMRRFLIGYMG